MLLFYLVVIVAVIAVVLASLFFPERDPELEHECTSWMVFHDLTGNNTNILHKNRDAKARDIAVFLSPEDSPRKWIALGTTTTNMGMSTTGLAGVMNSGEICIEPSPTEEKNTAALFRIILDSCDTAAQAVDKLKEIQDAGNYTHGPKGSIFFFMDVNEAYICEMTTKTFVVQPYKSGYAVRANIWNNPGMQYCSRCSLEYYLGSSARAYTAYSGLNKVLDKNGRISLPDIFELSRNCELDEGTELERSLCYKRTNSAASLEIDRQYPDVLSSGYFTVGHPRHTIYVPVPVCAEKLLPSMTDFSWSKAAFKRFDAFGYQSPVPREWKKFEDESFAGYTQAKETARKLLDEGRREEAVKLLNDTAYDIWCKAEALLLA